MKTYLAYVRVSTVKQGQHGSSLQEQRSAIEAYAQRHGLEIVGWYEEMETAAKQGRSTFNRLLTDLRKRRAAGVILHKIDRGARNLKDWSKIVDLSDQGLEVHLAHESLDLLTRGGRLAADIQAVVAADFIRNLRDEVRKGIRGRLKQGYYPFAAPLGYLDRGKAVAKAIDPLKGPLVAEAFERYASGQYTLEPLRQVMATLGLVGRGGRPVAKAYLADMLQNPFYIGVIRLRTTGETFQGLHAPLIPKALFDRVQDVLSGRAFAREQRHRHLYRRLIRCAACGRLLTGERQKGRVYYRCHAVTCRGVSVAEAEVDKLVDGLFALVAFTDEELRDLGDLLTASETDLRDAERAAKAEAALRLERCDARLEALTDALLDGRIDKTAYDERRPALLIERRGYLDQIEAQVESPSAQALQKFERAKTAQLGRIGLTPDQIRESLLELSSNLVVEGKRLGVRLRFPFDVIAKWRLLQECGPLLTAVRTFPITALVSDASNEVPQVLMSLDDGTWCWRPPPEHGRLSQARVQDETRAADTHTEPPRL
ncbi:recombinase family protein [Phenylobacterium sp. LH3H17]|uniref:recombinase family protein n=1 Tax=Phenylobacterium sp. LH3H17 TaxID=2903901 RepID=UPI0020C9BD3C|nr:recombinase family protein [Phenylobacterium sp. LH3H17]UTP39790.1 recombinase family protein [Phenylobacterium sp. LH3H17]